MARVSWTSELMDNYIAADTIPHAKHICTCYDADSQLPLVFALVEIEDDVPRLLAIATSSNGAKVQLDLTEILGLPQRSHIEAFEARQTADGSIYLCVATRAAERESLIWMARPFTTLSATTRLSKLQPVQSGRVHAFRIASVETDSKEYPQIFAIHQPLHRLSTADEVSRIQVNQASNTAELWRDLSVPGNGRILDIAPAAGGRMGRGLFYLVQNSEKSSLLAQLLRPARLPGQVGTWATYRLQCPKDACSIESFIDFENDEQSSGLIVGSSSGLHWILLEDVITGNPALKTLSERPIFHSPKSLVVTQENNNLSIWSINSKLELSSLTTNTVTMDDQRSSLLLPEGRATVFSPMIYKPPGNLNGRQTMIVNSGEGELVLMQQSLDTGIWRTEPFYAAAPGSKVTKLQTYTINITVEDTASNPVAKGEVFVKPSSDLPLIVNGQETILTSQGSWQSLDMSGELALIVPTLGMSIQPISVQECRTMTRVAIPFAATLIDPSLKVMEKLETLTTFEGLSTATTKEGKSLWDGVERPSENDLKGAASCFKAIVSAHAEVPADGSRIVRDVARVVKQAKFEAAGVFGEVENLFMDGYHWVMEKVNEAVNWAVRKINDIWVFVCTIANSVKMFVLDCVEKVKEAASWVWGKLKLGWQKLTEFVGFLFSWNDMLETKDTIKALLNGGLDFVEYKVESLNHYIDGFFDTMDKRVLDMLDIISNATNVDKVQKTRAEAAQQEDKQEKTITSSPAVKWCNERMKNDKSRQAITTMTAESWDKGEEVDFWEKNVQHLFDDVVRAGEQLATDVVDVFKGNHDMSPMDLLIKLGGSLILNVLKVVRDLIKLLISSVVKLIGSLKAACNTKVPIGFINALYRSLTGSDLTLFDAVALVIAIPSTIIIKIVTGDKPPALGDTRAAFFEKFIKGDTTFKATDEYKNAKTVVAGSVCGVAVVKTAVSVIKLEYKTATVGLDSVVKGLSPGTIMEIYTFLFDLFTVGKGFMEPPGKDDPGAWQRNAVNIISGIRLYINLLYVICGKQGMSNEMADLIMLVIDLYSSMLNVGLNTWASIEEIDTPTWKDYDAISSGLACTDNLAEAVKAVGYFTAFSCREKNPPVTLAGLVCLQVAGVITVVTKTGHYRRKWEKELRRIGN